MNIYGTPGGNLGDAIAFVNWCINNTPKNEPLVVSKWSFRRGHRTMDCRDKLRELFALWGMEPELVDEDPTTVPTFVHMFDTPFHAPHGYAYKGGEHICYQLDAAKSSRGIPDSEIGPMIQELARIRTTYRLWKERSLESCCQVLSTCKCFVGVNSGMSHLAYCVGTPVILFSPSGETTHHQRQRTYQLAKTRNEVCQLVWKFWEK